MEYRFGKVEVGSVDGEIKSDTAFVTGARHTSTRIRARPLRDGQVELSLDQYSQGTGKRGKSTYTSIVLSHEQAEALREVLNIAAAHKNIRLHQ